MNSIKSLAYLLCSRSNSACAMDFYLDIDYSCYGDTDIIIPQVASQLIIKSYFPSVSNANSGPVFIANKRTGTFLKNKNIFKNLTTCITELSLKTDTSVSNYVTFTIFWNSYFKPQKIPINTKLFLYRSSGRELWFLCMNLQLRMYSSWPRIYDNT